MPPIRFRYRKRHFSEMDDLIRSFGGFYVRTSSFEVDCDPWEEVILKGMVRTYLPDLHITRVSKVDNKFMKDMYLLKKEEYKSRYGSVIEKQLLHATSAQNVESILSDNFDWRSKYGKGISFSEDADYANFHCNRQCGTSRAFIVSSVLVSNVCLGNCSIEIPSGNYNTAISDNGKVYVKFSDNEFLPVNVVYYDAPALESSRHFRFNRRRHLFNPFF